ncbi:MAG: hypothetical protein E7286_02575 [Lachnospiraceae bacterium]|nr:hypothetical protein [Lachnospiraceae bacterium]
MFFIFSIPATVVLFLLAMIGAVGYAIVNNVFNIIYTLLIILCIVDAIGGWLLNNYHSDCSKKCVRIRTVQYILIAFYLHILRDERFIDVNATVLIIVVLSYLSLNLVYHKICRSLDQTYNKGLLLIPILILLSSILLPVSYYVTNGIERSAEKTAEISTYIVLEETEMYGVINEMIEVLDFKAHEKRTVSLSKLDMNRIKWHLKPGTILTYEGATVDGYVLCKMKEQPGLQGFVPVEKLKVYETQ